MSDEVKVLGVGIKVTSDTTGAKESQQAFEQLGLSASATANKIQVALARTEVAERSQSVETRAAASEKAQAALKQIESSEKAGKAAEDGAKHIRELGKATKELGSFGRETGEILAGLERGGIEGLAQAGRGANGVLKTLASGTLGGLLLPALAAAGGAFAIFKSVLNDTALGTKRFYDEAAKASEAYKNQLASNLKANELVLKKQEEDIRKIAAAYDEVTAASARSFAQQEKITKANAALKTSTQDADEKAALAKAQTPEAKEKISRDAAARRTKDEATEKLQGFNTADVKDNTDIKNAEEAQRIARGESDRIQATIDAAKKKAEGLTATAGVLFEKNGATGPTKQAQAEALAAKKSLEELVKSSKPQFESNSETLKKQQEVINSANDSKGVTAIDRQTFQQELRGKQADLSVGDPELLKASRSAAADVASTRAEIQKRKDSTVTGGFGAKADTADLEQKLTEQQSALTKAQKAQEADRLSRQSQSSALSTAVKSDQANRAPSALKRPGEESQPAAAGYAVDAAGNITIADRRQRSGPGTLTDSSGRKVAANESAGKGPNKISLNRGSDSTTASGANEISALIAAVHENTAALRAMTGGGGGAGGPAGGGDSGGITKAADGVKKSGDAVVKAVTEISKSTDKVAKVADNVAKQAKSSRERSGGG